MKVSIITPTYNSSKFIRETIDSILNQSYSYWELLITDDCSTDSTWNILLGYAKRDSRIKIFQLKENSGAGIARNNSIKHASGKYIAFCDSDDCWAVGKLEKQLHFMKEKKLAFTYSAYQKVNEKGEPKGIVFPPSQITFSSLLKSCDIGCLTVIYDTEKIGKVFMPTIRKRQDYGLWLKIFKIIGETEGIHNEVLAYYRVRKGSISSNKLVAAKYHYKVLREVGEISFIKASYNLIFYFIYGSIKYLK